MQKLFGCQEIASTATPTAFTHSNEIQDSEFDFQKLVLASLSTNKLQLQHVEETQEQITALVKAIGSGRKIGVLSLGLPVTALEELDDLEQTIRTTPERYQEIIPFDMAARKDQLFRSTYKSSQVIPQPEKTKNGPGNQLERLSGSEDERIFSESSEHEMSD
ncbi:unnamed protein product [Allacma fusca]|uniref:Uncharacterized protein n=1 Tax=Allacma fusca TaxID=39272 RepID=A0A8J2NZM6_9HEXA|nr:unnamed protein product [Allacma fusca]